MRKIERQMMDALHTRRPFKSGNTEVTREGTVYLHGNRIAYRGETFRCMVLDTDTVKRWNTVTTRSRCNAMGFSVRQRDFQCIIDRDIAYI